MSVRRAILTVTVGPNEGDTLSIEQGSCRLVGRHLSESETALIGRDGNRLLDDAAEELITRHLKARAVSAKSDPAINVENTLAFERGPDIVLSDDSISRAHAMVFYDKGGAGIIDLASTNGTFLNTERVASAMVNDGDAITIGNSELVVSVR